MKPTTGKEMQWRARSRTWAGRVRGADGQRSAWVDLGTGVQQLASARLETWIRTGQPPPLPAQLLGSQREINDLYGAGFARFPEHGGPVEVVRAMAGEDE